VQLDCSFYIIVVVSISLSLSPFVFVLLSLLLLLGGGFFSLHLLGFLFLLFFFGFLYLLVLLLFRLVTLVFFLHLFHELGFFISFSLLLFGLLSLLALFPGLGFLIIEKEVVTFGFLFLILARVHLVNTRAEINGVASKSDVHQLKELVHSRDHAFRGSAVGVFGWDTIEENDLVGHVGSHNEIVLNNEGSTLGRHNPTLHDLGGNDTLFGVEIGTGLINEINIAALSESEYNSHTLELTTRKSLDIVVQNCLNLEGAKDFSLEDSGLPGLLKFKVEQVSDRAFEFRSNELGLVGNTKLGDLSFLVIGL